MVRIRLAAEESPAFPEELELTVRQQEDARTWLLEHRGAIGPLLRWMGGMPVEDAAIGTEDLHSLYNQYHGPDVVDEDDLGLEKGKESDK
jgi:ABC-2 type transport system ATP-binding protein